MGFTPFPRAHLHQSQSFSQADTGILPGIHSFIHLLPKDMFHLHWTPQRELTSETTDSAPASYIKLTPCTFQDPVPPSAQQQIRPSWGPSLWTYVSGSLSRAPSLLRKRYAVLDHLASKTIFQVKLSCLLLVSAWDSRCLWRPSWFGALEIHQM